MIDSLAWRGAALFLACWLAPAACTVRGVPEPPPLVNATPVDSVELLALAHRYFLAARTRDTLALHPLLAPGDWRKHVDEADAFAAATLGLDSLHLVRSVTVTDTRATGAPSGAATFRARADLCPGLPPNDSNVYIFFERRGGVWKVTETGVSFC